VTKLFFKLAANTAAAAVAAVAAQLMLRKLVV